MDASLVGPISQGAALLIVAWVIFHVFSKLLPAMAADRRQERQEERTDYLASLERIEAKCEAGHLAAREAFSKEIHVLGQSLDRHSMQISGLTNALLKTSKGVQD